MTTDVASSTVLTAAPNHYQKRFSGSEFKARHQRIYDGIGSDAVAFVQGADIVDGFTVPRQTNEMMYLTGVEVHSVYLLLDGRNRSSTIYLPPRDEKHAKSEGDEVASQDTVLVRELTGCNEVKALDALWDDLRGTTVLYTPHQGAEGYMACQDTIRFALRKRLEDPWTNHQTREAFLISLIHQRLPGVEVRDLSPTLNQMRLVKSDAEIAAMAEAGRLTGQAVHEAMKVCHPGMHEYELGALAQYIYQRGGERGHGYRPIIASGPRIWQIHYYRNNHEMLDGDLVLMDTGAEVCNYTSDIGRMWPVNGKFDSVQRQLCGFMTEFHKALMEHIVAGVTVADVMRAAVADMEPVFRSTKWIKPAYEAAARRVLDARPSQHLTHPVGMAVHDVGKYHEQPMPAGLVFALDPQMWVPEEERYVRIEDTVVVTDSGIEVLTAAAPIELDEMESIVGTQSLPFT